MNFFKKFNAFHVQNIIYEVKVFTDFNSPECRSALHALEESYFGKESRPHKPIASISATLGAELLIEFDTVDVS
jgi:hypothetical protein